MKTNTTQFKLVVNTKSDNQSTVKEEKKEVAIARNKLFDWKSLNIPIFTYKRVNKNLQIELSNMLELINHISQLQQKSQDIQQQISILGNQLNMFINNTLGSKVKFDYTHQFIIIKKNSIAIYEQIEYDTALVKNEVNDINYEDPEDIITLLPPKQIYSITYKQSINLSKIYSSYIKQLEELDYTNEDYEQALELSNHLLLNIEQELMTMNIINISTDDVPEQFNDTKHDIILVPNGNKLELFYTYQQHKMTILQLLNK